MLIVLFLFYLSYAECHVVNNVQDNVFVNVVASVQYRALADKASDAFYRLTNTREQIQSYVFDGKTATCFKL
jgi:hypothetical protein